MADVKISALSIAAALTSADLIPIVQADETKRATIGQIIDLVSNSISIISNAASAADAHASVASIAVTSVDGRATSLANVLAGVSTVSLISIQGLQSVVNSLSARLVNNQQGMSGQLASVRSDLRSAISATSNGASIQRASIWSAVSVLRSAISVKTSAAGASVRGMQSIVDAISNRISIEAPVGGGGGSVTSTEVSAVSQNASAAMGSVRSVGDISTQGRQSILNALSGRISAASAAATSADAHAAAASAAATSADAHANTASAAATSVDARALSNDASIWSVVSVLRSAISAHSVGAVSTHGMQSIVNALSNRISAGGGGAGSVTSTEASAISAQALSALNVLSNVVSNALSAGDVASNKISAVISGASVRSVGNVSTHGHQSILNALSNRISAGGGGGGSVTSTELSAVSQNASAAMGSVRSVGNVSTQGRQSILNALSQRISVAAGGSASPTSNAFSALSQAVSVLSATGHLISSQNVDASAVSAGAPVYAFTSAATFKRSNASVASPGNRVFGLVADAAIAVSAIGRIQTSGNLTLTTAQWDAITGQSGGLTPGSPYYVDVVTGLLAVTAPTTGIVAPVGVAINTTTMLLQISGFADGSSALNVLSVTDASIWSAVSVIRSAVSARSVGGISTHGVQSILNALSNRISAGGGGAGSVTSTEASAISAQALSALNVLSNVVSNALSAGDVASNKISAVISGASARSVGNVSTHGHQSILNALSNRISVAAGGSASPTSNEYSVLSQAHSALSQAHSALSQIVSVMSTTLSNAISQVASVETHASTASAAATSADAHAATASAAATSADAHASAASAAATSVLAGISAASARSVGDISTHGLQSVVNALSNRISTVAGGAGSVTSTEASAISQNASAAMGSVRSVGDISTQGRQSILNALSGRISHTQSLLSQAISVVSQAVSVVSTAASNALSVANAASNAVSNEISNRISAHNVLSQAISVVSQALSAHQLSAHGNISITSPTSGQVLKYKSVSAQWVNSADAVGGAGGSAVPSSAQYVSLVSTVSHLASIVSNISTTSGLGSATGLQNVVNALKAEKDVVSNRICVVSADLTSDRVSGQNAVSAQAASAINIVSAQLVSVISAVSVHAFSASGSIATSIHGLQSVVNQISNTFSNSMSAGSVVRANLSNLTSAVSVLSQKLSANALLSAQTRFVANTQSINVSTMTNVSGLSVSVEAGGMYEIDGQVFLSTSAPTTVGIRAGFTFPALAASRGGGRFFLMSIAQTATEVGAAFNHSASGSVLLSVVNTGMVAGNQGLMGWLAYFNVSAAGVVQLQLAGIASTAASPWQILSGSFIRSRRMR